VLPASLSDTLCRLATGGGFSTRKLHSDLDETMRPVILNGIEVVVTRADLADRSIFLKLEAIAPERRRAEAELVAAFEADRPALFGALLDGLVLGLQRKGEVQIEHLPRRADFALASVAREPAFTASGGFMAAYRANREEANEAMVEGDGVGRAIADLMAHKEAWRGTAPELLGELQSRAMGRFSGAERLPTSPRVLSQSLARIEPALDAIGVEVIRSKEGRMRRRMISLARGAGFSASAWDRDLASASSAGPAVQPPCYGPFSERVSGIGGRIPKA